MDNINLNPGGLIGALSFAGVAYLVLPINGNEAPVKAYILALVVGAFCGNFLWGLVFKKTE